MPLDNAEKFDAWVRERWYEKDALMEQYISTGRFPATPATAANAGQEGFLETEVKTRYRFEFLQIFTVVGLVSLLWRIIMRLFGRVASIVP